MPDKIKNILFANHLSGDDYFGGGELYFLWLCAKVNSLPGFRSFFLNNKEGDIVAQAKECGIDNLLSPYSLLWEMNYGPGRFRASFDVFLKRNAGDIVMLKELMGKNDISLILVNCAVNPLPAVAAKELGIPVIWMVNETFNIYCQRPKRIFNALFNRSGRSSVAGILDAYSNHVIFPSLKSCRSFAGRRYLPGKSSEIMPALRDDIYEDSLNFKRVDKNEHVVIGFAGLFVEHKGVTDFIRAAAQIQRQHKNARFVLCGATPRKDYLKKVKDMILRSGLKQKVEILGLLRDMREFYRRIDLFVMPSRQEPFGMVTAEAMSYGIPVIIYDTSGVGEIIGNNTDGFLIRPGHRNIAKKAVELMNDRKRCRSVGLNARSTVREQLSPEGIFKKHYSIIKELLCH